MTLLALAAFLSLGTGMLPAAELKVATVDLRKVVSEYNKSKEADATIKERQASFQKEYQDMQNGYTKMIDEASKLKEATQDKTLSEAVRSEKQKALEAKIQDLRGEERKKQEFSSMRSKQLEDQYRRMMTGIVEDVTRVVNDIGAKEKYNLILDKTGFTMSGTPAVMYAQDIKDLTDDVIKILNANAPAAKAPAAPAPAPTKK